LSKNLFPIVEDLQLTTIDLVAMRGLIIIQIYENKLITKARCAEYPSQWGDIRAGGVRILLMLAELSKHAKQRARDLFIQKIHWRKSSLSSVRMVKGSRAELKTL
jgi:hypothetical protein